MVNASDQPQSGRFAAGEHRFPLRVFFEDTDAGGVVYHANYLRYLERARSDMLHVAGIDQAAALHAGEGAFVIAELTIRYRRPARLGDALLVTSRVGRIGGSSLAVHQRVMREGEVSAEADVAAVLVGSDGRPRRLPAAWRETFARLQGELGSA